MRIWIGSVMSWDVLSSVARMKRSGMRERRPGLRFAPSGLRRRGVSDIAGKAPFETPSRVDYHPEGVRRREDHNVKRIAGMLTAALCLAAGAADAQDKYPTRPIKVLVPYAPGGAVDIVTRIVTEEMRQTLGQPFVVENKPGAYGILAIQDMARAAPDGYTVMFGNNNANVITPILY